MLEWLDRKIGRFAIQHLTLALMAGWTMVFLLQFTEPRLIPAMQFNPELVAQGEIWRLFTFLLLPPSRHPLWFLFALYFFHLMGTALNAQWGAFRYNLYILIGWAVTAATGMLSLVLPFGMEAGLVSSNAWILASIFLAFAWLWPNFQIMLFLIVPMKVKWLALLMWIGFGLTILFGDWTARLLALAALSNFFLFFGADIARRLRYGHRRMQSQLGEVRSAQEAFHRCHCCGITERDDTDRQFRVDTSTEGSPDICVPCLEQRKRAASDSQTDANA